MNIGIFETEHFEVAFPIIRIFDIPGNQLTIFVNEEMHRCFGELLGDNMQRYTWVVQPAHISKRRFAVTIYRQCRRSKIKVLFLNTVSSHFIYYGCIAALLPSIRTILTIHEANNFFRSRLSFHLRQSVRHVGKKILLHFCYAYNTIAEPVQQYLKTTIGVKKPVFCLPGAVFDGGNYARAADDPLYELRIVVPGTIDNRRRDYGKVFELLDEINRQSLPVTIVLAGGVSPDYGRSVIEQCIRYASDYTNLIFYDETSISQSEFNRQLDSSHFVWIPSVIKTVISDGIEETYGLTKSSGNIFDAVKHAKPMLVPAELIVSKQLQSSAVVYSSVNSLLSFLIEIIKSPAVYQQWSGNAMANSNQYTIEKVQQVARTLFQTE